MLKIAATFCAVLIAVSLFQILLTRATDSAAVVSAWVDLVAPAWVVSPARVLVPLILAAPAWASLAPEEWASRAPEELGSLVREWVSLVLEE
jgi:hypothetical protein